jgi:hypothetical protein
MGSGWNIEKCLEKMSYKILALLSSMMVSIQERGWIVQIVL